MHAAGAPPVTVSPAKWPVNSSPRVRRRYLSIRFRTSLYSQSENYHYSRRSQQYWDKFYKLHKNKVKSLLQEGKAAYNRYLVVRQLQCTGLSFYIVKFSFVHLHIGQFFKDRHYLEKDWGRYFDDEIESSNVKVVLEVGCGAGNTIFPLIATFPKLYVHACDFSPKAVTLVKSHANYSSEKMNVFVCDAAKDDLCVNIVPFTVDVVTLIFTLSAVSPCKMASILENCKQVLKPNGHILLRDYAVGDSAQVKLHDRNQMISENFYFRGDGTCSFYFSETYASTLFQSAGFAIVDINTYCKEITNHSRNITMQRRWIRGIFGRS